MRTLRFTSWLFQSPYESGAAYSRRRSKGPTLRVTMTPYIVKLGAFSIALPRNTVLAEYDVGVGEHPLELLHQGPLRVCGLHRVRVEDRDAGRCDDGARICGSSRSRCCSRAAPSKEYRSKPAPAVECLIGHRLDDLLNREHAGGVPRLLLRRTVLRDPVGDDLLLVRV